MDNDKKNSTPEALLKRRTRKWDMNSIAKLRRRGPVSKPKFSLQDRRTQLVDRALRVLSRENDPELLKVRNSLRDLNSGFISIRSGDLDLTRELLHSGSKEFKQIDINRLRSLSYAGAIQSYMHLRIIIDELLRLCASEKSFQPRVRDTEAIAKIERQLVAAARSALVSKAVEEE